VRYPIAGTVSFQWKSPDGQWNDSSGATCNIGKEGAFIACESSPSKASPIQVMITLPTRSREHGPVYLCGIGDVRHLQTDGLRTHGFGACVDFQLEVPLPAGQPQ